MIALLTLEPAHHASFKSPTHKSRLRAASFFGRPRMPQGLTPKQEKFAPSGQYYVYHLVDPFTRQTFYVGKGRGNRANHHIRDAILRKNANIGKELRIRQILRAGGAVDIAIVHTTPDEREAYMVERQHIAAIGTENLTNISKGGQPQAIRAYLSARDWTNYFLRRLYDGTYPPAKRHMARQLIREMGEVVELVAKDVGSRSLQLALSKVDNNRCYG